MPAFLVLGPLEVVGVAGPISLGGSKQRLVLAMLALRAGEVVHRETLIGALWGDGSPPSAHKTIESYVSRLRGLLRSAGSVEAPIEATSGGYRLTRDGNTFDWLEFDRLAAAAQEDLDCGRPAEAAARASDALALSRGRALAGMSDEPAIRAEATALEDRRLHVLELQAEAELALGRHVQVVSRLRSEAAREPSREHMQGLLMLALYRSGRQADALAVFGDVRRQLVEELGLEPMPELRDLQQRILLQDPALAAPRADAAPEVRGVPPAAPARWSVRRRVAVGLALSGAAAFVLGAMLAARDGGESEALAGILRAPAIGVLSARSGQPRAAVRIATAPSRVTSGLGSVWATSYGQGTLTRVAPGTGVTQTVRIGHGPTGVVVAAGSVWVAATLDNAVTRVDGATSEIVQRVPVGASPSEIAAGAGALWVSNSGDGTVTRVDLKSGRVLGETHVGPVPAGLAVDARAVWVAVSQAGVVARLDPATGRVIDRIRVGSGPSLLAIGGDGVWVANELDSTVSLIDPSRSRVVLTKAVPGTVAALATTRAALWVAARDAAVVTRVDASGATGTVALPSRPTALAPGPGGLIVGVRGTTANHRGGTLAVRLSYPIDAVNPYSCCNLPPNVRSLAYDGLLGFSKSPSSVGTLVADLALEIPRAQRGGRSYTFRLRPGLRYSTGAPVRASDLRRGLELAARTSDILAKYIGALPGALDCPRRPRCDLRRVVETDDRAGTVTLRLGRPDPELLLALGLPAFAPVPAGDGIVPATGPYRVARFVGRRLIVFERNRFFREWAPAAQPAGYPDRIVVRSGDLAEANVDAVLRGRADFTSDSPTAGQRRGIRLHSPGQLHVEPLAGVDYLFLNTHAPPFDDVRVRRALNLAVDRGAIARRFGDATPTCQIVPATITGHHAYCPYTRSASRAGRWTAPDLARARRLVAASRTRGATVRILTQRGLLSEAPTARYVVATLRRLGYRARLRIPPPGRGEAAINDVRRPAQIGTSNWIADYPSASQWIVLQLGCDAWKPPARLSNHAQFCDARVDRWAREAARVALRDPATATRLWARADRRITDLAPWVPTVTESETDLMSRRVGNYQYVPTIGALLDQLWVR